MSEHIIERAFQLARSGQCRRVADIHQQLKREGFAEVQDHLQGRAIKGQLSKLMADARPSGR